jgi:lipoyl synthase
VVYINLTHCVSLFAPDLADGGAHHFAETVRKIKQKCVLTWIDVPFELNPTINSAPEILVEALKGDFAGSLPHVSVVAKSRDSRGAHAFRARPSSDVSCQSLRVLEHAKAGGVRITKTSIMLGLGETDEQLLDALHGERDTTD